jgi:four helix bundle protein
MNNRHELQSCHRLLKGSDAVGKESLSILGPSSPISFHEVQNSRTRRSGDLISQVSSSPWPAWHDLLQGCGKLTPKDKKRFFAIARGSVLEVSGALDVASALGLLPKQSHQDFQHKLLIITKMISALIKKT